MKKEKMEAARRHNGTATEMQKLTSTCVADRSATLHEIQDSYLAARFGLTAERARVVAQLAWGAA